ncbi:MAG TPA: serine/threonine-protein kinase [Anaerolineales bacterium]|nr:serine/threonine-protein kinase [Anaerolineales bacterium]HLO30836.1 serine/threonine-protein kinase [Anaerolineales bacterium]
MQIYPPGTRIGQYEIASRPMMGGMGVVYFALDHGNDGHPVALKTFRPEFMPDRAARDRFLREGTAWVELGSHPHIVRCYKVEYSDPAAFLVLELITKEQNMPDASLRSWLIPEYPLPIEQALLYALQIARGMQHATEKIPGFVHRDLKPENILVGADSLPGTYINRLRVTDFGLIKTITDQGAPASTSNALELEPDEVQFTRGVGTPLYMAPEQWKGDPVGVFTDVYAFGCILYEMLVGQPAAAGKTILELQAAHCEGRLKPIPANVSEGIAALTRKCLLLDSAKRYGTWNEILEALKNAYAAVSGEPVPRMTELREVSREERLRVGWSYNSIGLSYLDIGKFAAAQDNLALAIQIGQAQGEKMLQATALSSLGIACGKLSEYRRATEYLEQSLEIAQAIGDRQIEANSLANVGNAYFSLGRHQRGIECHEQSIKIKRSLGDRRGEAHSLGNLGIAYGALGQSERAIGYLEEALRIARAIGDQKGEANDLGNLGLAYFMLGQYQEAISYREQQLMIVRSIGYLQGEADALGNLGLIYESLGQYQRAVEYYEQHLEIAQAIGDQASEVVSLFNLGNTTLNLGFYERAIAYYEQNLRTSRSIGNRSSEAGTLAGLGIAYSELGQYQRAIEYLEGSLEIARAYGDQKGEADACFNLAITFTRLDDKPHALTSVQQAIILYASMRLERDLQKARKLHDQIQENSSSEVSRKRLEAFDAFMNADNLQALHAAADQHPILKDKQFIRIIEKIISEELPPEHKPAFEQRLAWLKQLAQK